MNFVNISKLNTNNSLFPSSNNITDEPLFKIQHSYLVLLPTNAAAKEIYNQFLTDLHNYSVKAAQGFPLDIYKNVSSRNIIFLGKNGYNSHIDIPGMSLLNNKNALAGIILDMNTLEIDSHTGISSKCDLAFYALYFEYIRNAITSNQVLVNKDSKLDLLVIKALYLLYLKILGSQITLNEKQKIFLQSDIAYFYFRFMKNNPHPLAMSNALSFNPESRDEVKFVLKTFEKYDKMKDIFKSFIDFKISMESPSVFIIKTINKFNMFTFYCFTTSLDYLISMIILSSYPTPFFPNLNINNQIQHEIENYLAEAYFSKIKYDSNYLVPGGNK